MFKIEKGVKIPSPRARYPFAEMEVGDSFFEATGKVANAAISFGKRNGFKFVIRKEGDGVRVWRVE